MTREKDKRYRRKMAEAEPEDDFEEADGGPFARLVTEIRDRGYSNRFTLSSQEAKERVMQLVEDQIAIHDLEESQKSESVTK